MASDCIFCRIVQGKSPSTVVYQDELVMAFRDIHPRAPKHILLIPKEHVNSLNDLVLEEKAALVGHLFQVAARVAKAEGVAESGYRMVVNCGPNAGQVVPHLHFHLLGGRWLGTFCGRG